MKFLYKIESLTGTLINLMMFGILVTVFVLVFIYPEVAGTIAGKIINGFNSIVKK